MTDSPSDPDSGAPPPPPVAVAPEQPSTPRPRWLGPAAVGVVLGVIVAFVAVLVTRGDDNRVASDGVPVATDTTESPTTSPAPTEVPTTTPDTIAVSPPTEPPATAPVESAPPATDPPTTEPPATDPPTTEPPAAEPPATTEAIPATTVAPATTAPPAPVPPEPTGPADDGFVRIGNSQFPIVRTCRTEPFAPRTTEYAVFSYLFLGDDGTPQIVDHWFDGDGVTGGSYSDNGIAVPAGYEFLGADEFAMNVRRGDATSRVVVNPPQDGAVECAGRVITNDVTTPGFTYTRSILDVCFGSQTGPLQYIGYLSEGGRFSVIPNADGTATLHYLEPFVQPFVDPAASSTTIDGGLEVRGIASSEGFTGPVTTAINVTIRAGTTRDCAPTDTPF